VFAPARPFQYLQCLCVWPEPTLVKHFRLGSWPYPQTLDSGIACQAFPAKHSSLVPAFMKCDRKRTIRLVPGHGMRIFCGCVLCSRLIVNGVRDGVSEKTIQL